MGSVFWGPTRFPVSGFRDCGPMGLGPALCIIAISRLRSIDDNIGPRPHRRMISPINFPSAIFCYSLYRTAYGLRRTAVDTVVMTYVGARLRALPSPGRRRILDCGCRFQIGTSSGKSGKRRATSIFLPCSRGSPHKSGQVHWPRRWTTSAATMTKRMRRST